MKDETNWNFWPCFCCFCCVRSELLVLFLCVYNKCSSEIKLLSGGLTKQTPTGRMEDGFLCHHLPSTWTDPAGSSWKTDSRHPAFLEKLVPCKMRLFEPSWLCTVTLSESDVLPLNPVEKSFGLNTVYSFCYFTGSWREKFLFLFY